MPDILNETFAQSAVRHRKEALTTPYFCLDENRQGIESWKIRVLRQGYCSLLTMNGDEPTKCTYCLIHKPYQCCFRVTAQELLFKKLFE